MNRDTSLLAATLGSGPARKLGAMVLSLVALDAACHGGAHISITSVTDNPFDQGVAAISGSLVAWEDERNADAGDGTDVFFRDTAGGAETKVAGGLGDQVQPTVSAGYVVWVDGSDIKAYDRARARTSTVTSAGGDQFDPALCGSVVVWTDLRNGNPDIFGKDLSGTIARGAEIPIAVTAADEAYPDCDGSRVVFMRTIAATGSDIYHYNLNTAATSVVSAQRWNEWRPAVSGDRVVWQAWPFQPDTAVGIEIYGRNLATGRTFAVGRGPGHQVEPDISGGLAAWEDRRAAQVDVRFRELATGVEEPVTAASTDETLPAVSGRSIVYGVDDGRDTDVMLATVGLAQDGSPPALSMSFVTDPIGPSDLGTVGASGTTDVTDPPTTVAVSVAAGTNTTPATGASVDMFGAWSASGIDVSSLPDGPLTVRAVATDPAGNFSTVTRTVTKDTTAPLAPTISLSPDPVNAAAAAAVTVSGNGEPGAMAFVSIDDSDPATPARAASATVSPSGSFSVTFDVTALRDGSLQAQAQLRDAAGNLGPTGLASAAKDTVAPAAPSVSTTPDPVNAASQSAVTVSGTGEVAATASITLDDTDPATVPVSRAVTVGTSGTFTASLDASALSDGRLTASVVLTDEAGNTGPPGSDEATKDATPPAAPTVSISPDPIDAGGQGAVTISGTGEVGSLVGVSVDDADTSTPPVVASATVAADATYAALVNLTPLLDGTIQATVVLTDQAGNVGSAGTATAVKSTTL